MKTADMRSLFIWYIYIDETVLGAYNDVVGG